MSTLYMTYSSTVVEDCEDVWSDGSGGKVTFDPEGTIKKVGTYSVKMTVASDASVGTLAYENFSSKNLSTYTHIVAWLYPTIAFSAGELTLMLDDTNGCPNPVETINIPALTANAWTRVILPLATPANCTAILSVGIALTADKAAFVLYVDDVRAVKCLTITQPRVVKGIDDPQRVEHNVLQNTYLDGSRDEQFVGFIRHPYVDIGVLSAKADRLKAFDFFRASDKCLIYGIEEVQVVNDDSSVFESAWLNDTELCPAFQFSFREKTMQTTSPASWSV